MDEKEQKTISFEEFKESLAESIRQFLPEKYYNCEVMFNDVVKSGIGKQTGMMIHGEGITVAPCLYIDKAYEDLTQYDLDIHQVISSVCIDYAKALSEGIETSLWMNSGEIMGSFDWENVKENCQLKAVPLSGNQEYLKTIPHLSQGDFAAICQINLGDTDKGRMSVTISEDLMKHMGIDQKTMFDTAVHNMTEQREPHIGHIFEIMMGLTAGGNAFGTDSFKNDLQKLPSSEALEGMETPMYVVTTADSFNGSALLFCPKIMDQVAEKYPGGFYVLPSSLHEFMIIPKYDGAPDLECLNDMVREINAAEVAPEDRLSDHVHEYDAKAQKLFIAGTTPPSLQQDLQAMTQAKPVHGSR